MHTHISNRIDESNVQTVLFTKDRSSEEDSMQFQCLLVIFPLDKICENMGFR